MNFVGRDLSRQKRDTSKKMVDVNVDLRESILGRDSSRPERDTSKKIVDINVDLQL